MTCVGLRSVARTRILQLRDACSCLACTTHLCAAAGWLAGDPCIPDSQGWAGVVCSTTSTGDVVITSVTRRLAPPSTRTQLCKNSSWFLFVTVILEPRIPAPSSALQGPPTVQQWTCWLHTCDIVWVGCSDLGGHVGKRTGGHCAPAMPLPSIQPQVRHWARNLRRLLRFQMQTKLSSTPALCFHVPSLGHFGAECNLFGQPRGPIPESVGGGASRSAGPGNVHQPSVPGCVFELLHLNVLLYWQLLCPDVRPLNVYPSPVDTLPSGRLQTIPTVCNTPEF